MTMSNDRVRFTVPGHRISSSSQSEGYRKLLEDCFGECLGRCQWSDITIICRPSQFARFLIERNNRGFQNQFSELKPELFLPAEEKAPTVFDVSGNSSRLSRLTLGKADR